ncbi:hypothetical protein WDW86_16780 [Bdellovibrionota bacterium FG-2]
MPGKTFGTFFRAQRMKRKLTLRKFCEDHEFDPGNISKIERDLFSAPQSDEKLREYANALLLVEGSDDWVEFFDLASVSNKTVGIGRISDETLLRKLPVLFRTLENKELTEEKLDQLIELIRRS